MDECMARNKSVLFQLLRKEKKLVFEDNEIKKKNQSPAGIEPIIFRTLVGCSNH